MYPPPNVALNVEDHTRSNLSPPPNFPAKHTQVSTNTDAPPPCLYTSREFPLSLQDARGWRMQGNGKVRCMEEGVSRRTSVRKERVIPRELRIAQHESSPREENLSTKDIHRVTYSSKWCRLGNVWPGTRRVSSTVRVYRNVISTHPHQEEEHSSVTEGNVPRPRIWREATGRRLAYWLSPGRGVKGMKPHLPGVGAHDKAIQAESVGCKCMNVP